MAARGRARPRARRSRDRVRPQRARRRRAAVLALARGARRRDLGPLAVAVALYEEAIRLARETGQATALCAGLAGLACVEARLGPRPPAASTPPRRSRETGAARARVLPPVGASTRWPSSNSASATSRRRSSGSRRRSACSPSAGSPTRTPHRCPSSSRRCCASTAPRRPERGWTRSPAAAEAKGQPWSLARLARCRGLLVTGGTSTSRGAAPARPHARPLRGGAHAALLRRGAAARPPARARRASRCARAVETFDALGAAPWAERARRELQASGETARRRDPLTLDELTPRELQVALVLADGHTIREAAAKLFLSPKTVDYHLRTSTASSRSTRAPPWPRALAEIPGAPPDAKADGGRARTPSPRR